MTTDPVSVQHHAAASYRLEEGDLVFARTGASVGKSYQYRATDGPLVFAGYLICVTPDPGTLVPTYLASFVRTEQFWSWVDQMSMRSGQPGINAAEYGQLPVVLPPPAEQHAIADALSDANTEINALDQLIAKKRDIKQGATVQLLTGNWRLPGFNAPWTTQPFRALGSTYAGLTGKIKSDFGAGSAAYVPFLNVLTNPVLDPTQLEVVNVGPSESQNRVSKNDLLLNTSSETPDEVGMCSVVLDDLSETYLNSFCFGFRMRQGLTTDPLFLTYLLRSPVGRRLLAPLAQGATRYNLSKASFLGLSPALPEFDEQRAIAAVLSDMDAEIAALERQRDKMRLIKQGMMQQLLTGRIRLK